MPKNFIFDFEQWGEIQCNNINNKWNCSFTDYNNPSRNAEDGITKSENKTFSGIRIHPSAISKDVETGDDTLDIVLGIDTIPSVLIRVDRNTRCAEEMGMLLSCEKEED